MMIIIVIIEIFLPQQSLLGVGCLCGNHWRSPSGISKSLSNLLEKGYGLEQLKPLMPLRKEENKTLACDIEDQPGILFICFPSASASYVPAFVGIYTI